jgi:hypothetical protein
MKSRITAVWATKRATLRDNSVPIGTAARLYVVCGCGSEVTVHNPDMPIADRHTCGKCGEVFDSRGWILKPGKVAA